LCEALADTIAQLRNVSIGLGHSDHRHSQMASLNHRLQGEKGFLECQITGGAEQYERIGI
jgi:hypothetical protein